jgi:uncharacterized phiE125 gp8 family phage protein
MWSPIVTTAAPASEPISLVEAKAHLQVEHASDDTYINTCIAAARGHVEAMTATRLVSQTVVMRTDNWDDLKRLPIAPIVSITSIQYVDTADAAQTVAGTVYEGRLYELEPSIVLKFNQNWPTIRLDSLITITAVAGYASVPPAILHAIKILVADMYMQRESGGSVVRADIAASVEALLSNHRIHLI